MTTVPVVVKWGNKEYSIEADAEKPVSEFKRKIKELTNVEPKRQKLIGLKHGGKPLQDDEVLVKDLQLKQNQKIMMVGTVEEKLLEEVPPHDDQVVDDFDIVFEEVSVKDHEDNHRKIQNRIDKLQVNVFNPPRPGKKLLVLDVDYTLMDHRSTVERAEELMRPHLHQFLVSFPKAIEPNWLSLRF